MADCNNRKEDKVKHSEKRRKRRSGRSARLLFPPLPLYRRLADWLMTPLMYVALGNWHERPQETHAWNYITLDPKEHFWIDGAPKVCVSGVKTARPARFGSHHLTWLGGWKRFVVLRPPFQQIHDGEKWYIGWRSGDFCGVSMIPLWGPVRMLIGPGDVEFFALNKCHKPVGLLNIGNGSLGRAGYNARYTLR